MPFVPSTYRENNYKSGKIRISNETYQLVNGPFEANGDSTKEASRSVSSNAASVSINALYQRVNRSHLWEE